MKQISAHLLNPSTAIAMTYKSKIESHFFTYVQKFIRKPQMNKFSSVQSLSETFKSLVFRKVSWVLKGYQSNQNLFEFNGNRTLF